MACSEIFIVLIVFSVVAVKCDITLEGVKCGQTACRREEYCSSYHRTCEPCSPICDVKNHNFDNSLCVKDCQDFLHDSRYVIQNGKEENSQNLKDTVQRLSTMISVTLTLVCFMLATLAGVLCFQLYRWKKKKNITLASLRNKIFFKKTDSNQQNKQNSNQNSSEKPDLRLEMPTDTTLSERSPATVSTSISRRPAEDSTLDYAYDNPAMSSSPTAQKTSPNSF